jgi:hypothetical protein
MNSSLERLLAVVIVLLLAGGIATLQDRNAKSSDRAKATPTPTDRIGTIAPVGCIPLPGTTKTPSWFPKNLPLPAGSYPARITLPKAPGYPRAIFAIKGTLRDFVIHVFQSWPRQGWQLGRGESEAGEAEDNFFHLGTNIQGAFVARTSFCDPAWTWVYFVMGTAKAPRPSPTTSVSPSPLRSP